MDKPTTSILIPAYNEERGIAVVLQKLSTVLNGDKSYEVIVVDDGSRDKTVEIASRYSCRIISHETNLGKGEAIKTGIRCALGENIISVDADNTYPVEIIPEMSRYLHEYEAVIASRFYGKNKIPYINRIGNFFIRNLIRYVYGFKPYDPLTGLWGFKKQYIIKILPEARYAPDAEMQIKAARMKLRIHDIRITYNSRVGETKLPPFRGGYEHLKLIIKLLRWQPDETNSYV